MRQLCCLLGLLPLACAAVPPPSPPSEAASMNPIAPPPFSAEQIRAATPDGRTYLFRTQAGEGAPTQRRIVFHAPDPQGAELEAQNLSMGGEPLGAPTRARVTWDELVGHASYPRAQTVISKAEITVEAGTFAARLYTVTSTATPPQITRAWFADALPGAPVRHIVQEGSKTVSELELVSTTPAPD